VLTIRVPAPPAGLVANLFGLLGLIGLAIAAGGLTGNWWWTLAVGSAMAVGLSYVAHAHAAAVAAPADGAAATARPDLRAAA